MDYKIIPYTPKPSSAGPSGFASDYGSPSVPNLPSVEIFDNVIDQELHHKLWDYINQLEWHQYWQHIPGELQLFKPCNSDAWINPASITRTLAMPRAALASDEASLKELHPLVHELWGKLNAFLGNRYEITGTAEGMYIDTPAPPTQDPNLEQGWRVYCNATVHDMISCGGHIHRDTPNWQDDTTATIIWVANKEWYPSWGGEIYFYGEDPEGKTGDHQQFVNAGYGQQKRGFNIGWCDDGKMASFRPNRLFVYDGRTLHAVTPHRRRWNCDAIRRIVFRARLKPQQ